MVRALAQYYRIFYRYAGVALPVYILLAFVGGVQEGIGISLFLPFFDQMGSPSAASSTPLGRALYGLLEWMGIGTSMTAIALLILAVIATVALIKCAQELMSAFLMAQLMRRLRRQLIGAYAAMDYRSFLGRNAGYLSNVMTREVEEMVSAFGHYAIIMAAALSLVVYVAVSLALDWTVWLIAAGVGGILAIGIRAMGEYSKRFSMLTSEGNGIFQQQLIQFLHGFKYLKATHTVGVVQCAVERQIDRLASYRFRLSSAGGVVRSLSEPVAALVVMVLFVFEVTVAHRPVAGLLVMLLLFYRIVQKILVVQNGWQTFCALTGSIHMLDKTLTELRSDAESPSGVQAPSFRQAIELRDVCFAFDSAAVLHHVNMTVRKGKFIALVGESGSGKSTLVNLLTGLLRPAQGQLLLDGVDYRKLDLDAWRSRIGYVVQESIVFQDTLGYNIALGAYEPSHAECRERLSEAASVAQLSDVVEAHPAAFEALVGDRGGTLSGGQRQRLVIAREVFRRPDLLILDEATSALDSDTEERIQQHLDRLRGKVTLILIAHRLSTIKHCDYVYVLSKGWIVEEGRYQELVRDPQSQLSLLAKTQRAIHYASPSSVQVGAVG